MWNVTTSSWFDEIGFVQNERLELAQEVGYASGKTGNEKESAFETLTTAFFSPYWDLKRGHLEFPVSTALFTKNFGNSNTPFGPGIAGGAVLQWQFARTNFAEIKTLAGWSKSYSILRSDKPYAIDPGFERSEQKPWFMKTNRVSISSRDFLSPVSYVDTKMNLEQLFGSHENSSLNVARKSISTEVFLFRKSSDEYKNAIGGAAFKWEKRVFNRPTELQKGSLGKIYYSAEYTPSSRNLVFLRLDALIFKNPRTLSSFEGVGEWQYLLTRHCKNALRVERNNDIFNLEGSQALRDRAQSSVTWRDFSRYEAGFTASVSRVEIQTGFHANKRIEEWQIEPTVKTYWSYDLAFGGRLTLAKALDRSETLNSSS